MCLHHLQPSGVAVAEYVIGNINICSYTPHPPAGGPQPSCSPWPAAVVYPTCCILPRTIGMVGYAFSASHVLISSHPVFPVQPSIQLCDNFLLCSHSSSCHTLILSEHHSSSAAVALARSQQNSTLPDHVACAHLGGLFLGDCIDWVWLLPSLTSRYSWVKSIYELPVCWKTSVGVSPPAPPPTPPTIGSPTRLVPMNSQASEPGYFFLVRTSQADLRDIHVPSSSSPAPPFVEI